MAAFALDIDAKSRRRRDGGNDSEIDLFLFENRPLLNVELDERRIAASRQQDLRQFAGETCGTPDFVERSAIRIAQRFAL